MLARFREQRDELVVQAAAVAGKRWKVNYLVAAGALAAAGVIGAVVVHPAVALLLLPALALLWAARPDSEQGVAMDMSSLKEFEGRSLAELDEAARDEDQRVMALEAADAERERSSKQRQERFDGLQARLAEAIRPYEGDGEPEDLLERADVYLKRCDGSREHAEAVNSHRQLTAELGKRRGLQSLRERLGEHERNHGKLEAIAGDAAVLESERETVVSDLRDVDLKIAQLGAVTKEREERLADPADLEVQLADVRSRRERAEFLRDATRIAREALHEAAHDTHRRVAPHLNAALRRDLPRITRGRYEEGTVDEDLSVRLYAPESWSLVSVEQLSRGTRDQVALVQRLEIARLLDPTAGQAPLLLDDPFAHFDSERLRLGAELIVEAAERRQVVLFTEDAEVIGVMKELSPSSRVIDLPDPVAS